VLQACLNGDRSRTQHPAIPLSPEELASEARVAVAAGAGALHIHPRNGQGAESLFAEPLAACLRAVRSAVPGVPIGIGTSSHIVPAAPDRLPEIARWSELPDNASVNLSEPGWQEQMTALMTRGVGIEAGVWSPEDAERLLSFEQAGACLRVLIEMINLEPEEAKRRYRETRAVLEQGGLNLPLLLHGEEACAWEMVHLAGQERLDTRAGFEDMLTLPDGTPAPDTGSILRAARLLACP